MAESATWARQPRLLLVAAWTLGLACSVGGRDPQAAAAGSNVAAAASLEPTLGAGASEASADGESAPPPRLRS